jgi:DNA-binding transcriptional regulator YiaG
VDYELLASQLVRAIRGRRRQVAFSRRIGCQSNVLYTWEAGRRYPTAARFFEVAARAGVDVPGGVARFLRSEPAWLKPRAALDAQGVAQLLHELKGNRALSEIARATDKTRFRVARWFSGQTEPRLPDFLELVHVTSYRLLDFVAALVDPLAVPLVAAPWRELEAARQAAYASPWCHVVLRLLETERLRAQPSVSASQLAGELGISTSEARSSLDLLEATGQIERRGQAWDVKQVANVDLAEDPEAMRRIKAWATEVALGRIREAREGLFSYNLFCVSERDYLELQRLQRAYFRQLRAIVAESAPSERVVMTNLQLFSLSR